MVSALTGMKALSTKDMTNPKPVRGILFEEKQTQLSKSCHELEKLYLHC